MFVSIDTLSTYEKILCLHSYYFHGSHSLADDAVIKSAERLSTATGRHGSLLNRQVLKGDYISTSFRVQLS